MVSNLFKIKLGEEVNIIPDERNIIMKLKIKEKMSIMIGVCEQNIFKTEIYLYFNKVEYLEEYFSSINQKGLSKEIKNFYNNEIGILNIKNDNIDIGIAFKINWVNDDAKKIKNNNKNLLNENENKGNKNNYFGKNGEPYKESIKKNLDINGQSKKNNNKQKAEIIQKNLLKSQNKANINKLRDNIKNMKNIDIIINKNSEKSFKDKNKMLSYNNDKNNDKYTEINSGRSNTKKQEKIKEFTEKETKGLIFHYVFICKLKNILKSQTKESNIEFECYLINKEWINGFKDFYLYKELTENIINIEKNGNININDENNEEIMEKIYEKLLDNKYNDYFKKIEESDYPEDLEDMNNSNYELNFSESNKEKIINTPFGFEIINNNTYNNIKNRKNGELTLIKRKYFIKNGKIIIRFDDSLNIIIGSYDSQKDEFILERILSFKEKGAMIENFNDFKNQNIEILNLEKEKEKENNEIQKEIFGQNKIINENEKISLDFDTNKIKCFKFLIGLYFYFRNLNEKINENFDNNSNLKKGFLINKDLIENYNEYFDYNKIEKDCKDNGLSLSENNINYNEEGDNNKFLSEIINSLKHKYIEVLKKINDDKFYKINDSNQLKLKLEMKSKNNKDFYYYENCVIINEELFSILCSYNEQFKNNIKDCEITYLTGDKIIIIAFKPFINIGFIDDNKKFIPEMVINYNTDNLEKIINDLKYNGYKRFKNIFEAKYANTKNYSLILNEKETSLELRGNRSEEIITSKDENKTINIINSQSEKDKKKNLTIINNELGKRKIINIMKINNLKFPNVGDNILKLFLSNKDNNDDVRNNNNSKSLEEQIKKENFKEDLKIIKIKI